MEKTTTQQHKRVVQVFSTCSIVESIVFRLHENFTFRVACSISISFFFFYFFEFFVRQLVAAIATAVNGINAAVD